MMREELIAPCGMNCAICSAYLAHKSNVKKQGIRMSYCIGCRARDKQCAWLKKRCDLLLEGRVQYCFECGQYPCERLSHIDRRYRASFRMSFIENLESIKNVGIKKFLENESSRWKCPNCGGVICCHNGICFSCGLERLRAKNKKYRWED